MKQRLGYVVAFLAGVLLTVVVYETVRVVTTASQALTAASNQLASGNDGTVAAERVAPSSRSRGPATVASKKSSGIPRIQRGLEASEEMPDELRDDPELDPETRLEMARKREAISKQTIQSPAAVRRARRAARKAHFESLSPEEQEAIRERRRVRRARRAARVRGGGRLPEGEGDDLPGDGPEPGDEPPVEPDTGL